MSLSASPTPTAAANDPPLGENDAAMLPPAASAVMRFSSVTVIESASPAPVDTPDPPAMYASVVFAMVLSALPPAPLPASETLPWPLAATLIAAPTDSASMTAVESESRLTPASEVTVESSMTARVTSVMSLMPIAMPTAMATSADPPYEMARLPAMASAVIVDALVASSTTAPSLSVVTTAPFSMKARVVFAMSLPEPVPAPAIDSPRPELPPTMVPPPAPATVSASIVAVVSAVAEKPPSESTVESSTPASTVFVISFTAADAPNERFAAVSFEKLTARETAPAIAPIVESSVASSETSPPLFVVTVEPFSIVAETVFVIVLPDPAPAPAMSTVSPPCCDATVPDSAPAIVRASISMSDSAVSARSPPAVTVESSTSDSIVFSMSLIATETPKVTLTVVDDLLASASAMATPPASASMRLFSSSERASVAVIVTVPSAVTVDPLRTRARPVLRTVLPDPAPAPDPLMPVPLVCTPVSAPAIVSASIAVSEFAATTTLPSASTIAPLMYASVVFSTSLMPTEIPTETVWLEPWLAADSAMPKPPASESITDLSVATTETLPAPPAVVVTLPPEMYASIVFVTMLPAPPPAPSQTSPEPDDERPVDTDSAPPYA